MLLAIFLSFIIGRMTQKPQSINKELTEEVSQHTILSPQITVVFQQDIEDDEDLCKEVADMYLSNRAFYYAGKAPQESSVLSEEEMDVFVRFSNIDFNKLQKIEI